MSDRTLIITVSLTVGTLWAIAIHWWIPWYATIGIGAAISLLMMLVGALTFGSAEDERDWIEIQPPGAGSEPELEAARRTGV